MTENLGSVRSMPAVMPSDCLPGRCVDVRAVVGRDGLVRLRVEGRPVPSIAAPSLSAALAALARRLEAIAWTFGADECAAIDGADLDLPPRHFAAGDNERTDP